MGFSKIVWTLCLAVALLATSSRGAEDATTATTAPDRAEAAPGPTSKPTVCTWFPEEDPKDPNYKGFCKPNLDFTLLIKEDELKTGTERAGWAKVQANAVCQKADKNETACTGDAEYIAANCVYDKKAEKCSVSNFQFQSDQGCPGSNARNYYGCRAISNQDKCETTKAFGTIGCTWAPWLSDEQNSYVSQVESCFAADFATAADANEIDTRVAATIKNDTLYTEQWGTCDTAATNLARRNYNLKCNTSKSRSLCEAANCNVILRGAGAICLGKAEESDRLLYKGGGIYAKQLLDCQWLANRAKTEAGSTRTWPDQATCEGVTAE